MCYQSRTVVNLHQLEMQDDHTLFTLDLNSSVFSMLISSSVRLIFRTPSLQSFTIWGRDHFFKMYYLFLLLLLIFVMTPSTQKNTTKSKKIKGRHKYQPYCTIIVKHIVFSSLLENNFILTCFYTKILFVIVNKSINILKLLCVAATECLDFVFFVSLLSL